MWHKIENIAQDHFLSTNIFKAFCLNECIDNCSGGSVHSMDIDLLISRYRQSGFKERILPANNNT